MEYPTPGDDYIDSRDVIAAIEELGDRVRGAMYSEDGSVILDGEDIGEEVDQLAKLSNLEMQGSQYGGDWPHGTTLIHESAFLQYAEDFASDIGAIPNRDAEWPCMFIDWDAAADALKIDYTEISFDGEAYYVR